jgi:hypothetical protein
MKPWLAKMWYALVNDEMAVKRWVRILFAGFGLGGVGAVQYAPEAWRLWLFLAAGLAGCVAAGINLGDKNPPTGPEAKP